MFVGFDSINLASAVEMVIKLAADRDQTDMPWRSTSGKLMHFDLTDRQSVSDYLMSRAEDVYARSSNAGVAQIRDTPYISIGVLFEKNDISMSPPATSRGKEQPIHIAYFWQLL